MTEKEPDDFYENYSKRKDKEKEEQVHTITNIHIDNDMTVGRLGNKLFVIAAGLGAAAKRSFCDFKIPHWKYEADLPAVPIAIEPIEKLAVHQEPHFNYEEIPDNGGNLNITGYFQSERYFKHIEKEIKEKWFVPSKDVQKDVDELFQHKGDFKFTSIHVRRGDYLVKSEYHPPQPMEYFNKAMEMLDPVTDRYLIFSDDIAWCKENIKGDNILYSEGRKDIVDLFMISKCDNHIISNSSYSWWGSWLCQNPDKRVIAPLNWFGPAMPLETKDLYCDGWEII